jgi:DNA helicase-2/ATP-dependent DNA helicase PcrA
MDFTKRYNALNLNQKKAVNTIEGPVMVVAGPGTGKTELLSMRAANILRQTDVLPENILCLTFTDSGSVAMQQRLTDIIGKDAYNVSIFTFHSFGAEIMARHREYFYKGAEFRAADELHQRQILTSILETLPYTDPFASKMNGEFTALSDIKSALSDLKRSSLTEEELIAILDANDYVIERTEPLLQEVFSERISKTTPEKLTLALEKISLIDEPQPIMALPRLSDVMKRSLASALEASLGHEKVTPPITEWKKQWMTLDADKQPILKAKKQQEKLRSLVYIYAQYVQRMREANLFDFDDMIVEVVQALETHPELRYELQESYQYIMVDEFQDTNLAQMRILLNLSAPDVNEGSPNILVVGDDDQAIYGFQGADVSNILSFRTTFQDVEVITLTDNYRSAACILEASRNVITRGTERLEHQIPMLNKTLTPHASAADSVAELVSMPTLASERAWLAESIKTQMQTTTPSSIAVIARRHSDLEALLPYFKEANISVSYDKRDNILDDEVVIQLELLAEVVLALSESNLTKAETHLPELLAHPAWGVSTETLWRISLSAHKEKQNWLETLATTPETTGLHGWLLKTAQQATFMPLERILDILLGCEEVAGEFTSPLKKYFFDGEPASFLAHLSNLAKLRNSLREHDPDTSKPRLAHLTSYLRQVRQSGGTISSTRHIGDDAISVRLLTAHASKGLEFDTVYVINAIDTNWGSRTKSRSSVISYPEHMRLRQNTNSLEERLRLFFVAMTRAKRQLFISFAHDTGEQKPLLRASFLVDNPALTEKNDVLVPKQAVEQSILSEWYAPIVELPSTDMQSLLAPILERYRLSATHVNTFIDVTRGGPQHFLLNNLLRFPSAQSPHAGFGNAVHTALQQAHDYFLAHKTTQPEEDIVRTFEQSLQSAQLTDEEYPRFLEKGSDALRTFLRQRTHHFSANQRPELNLASEHVYVQDVRLTGKLDVVEIDEANKELTVIDYKTGGALQTWDKGTDAQKVKAHKYRQQLMLYHLLLAHSRSWRNYTVTSSSILFVEPDKRGEIVQLEITSLGKEEVEEFSELLVAIWQHIHALNFPDTSHYEATLKGIEAFEDDLRAGKI